MNNGRGYEPTLRDRADMIEHYEWLKERCMRSHQIAMIKWVLAVLIVTLSVLILTGIADDFFDTGIAYYRQMKMVILVVTLVLFFTFAGKRLYKLSSKEWQDYLSDEERAVYEDRMNETCIGCYTPAPPRDLDCIYSDEKCVSLIVEASKDSGIVMVGGQVEVFYSTHDEVVLTPDNSLSKMLIQQIIQRKLFEKDDIIYINSNTELEQGRTVASAVAATLTSNINPHLLFVIDRFYASGNLDTALMLSRRGHSVIALAHPHQSPFLYKTIENSLVGIEDYKKKAAIVGFIEEVNLVVMRDSASMYRSLDIHKKVETALITKLCDKGAAETYSLIEDLTTSPQTPPPLRF